jgi:hypothetical protein
MMTARSFRLSRSLYGFLLLAYPWDLRDGYGKEMERVFAEQLSGAWRQRGLAGAARVWTLAGWELVRVAAPLHLRNPALIAAALSFVSASALALAFFRAVSPHVYKY